MKNPLSLVFLMASIFSTVSIKGQENVLPKDPIRLLSVQEYIDSLVISRMAEYRIPGTVVSIIHDSTDVYTKGYGYADLENQKPVDPAKTIFRVASVTKTFTAFAAMQLDDEGKLDLHTDVKRYLPDEDFEFISWKPVTMHQLLTHTAGFDLTDTGDAAWTPSEVTPLEELARNHMPDQVHTPGEVYSYSNFGYALAGYIIQFVSGMPYQEYIKSKILDPLGMEHTGIDQPLPSPLNQNLSKSYVWDGNQIPLKRDYTNTLPGGGIMSSGQDMANYMIMHLHKGQFNGTSILSPEGHKALTSQQYGSKNTKYGMCYAFNENMWNGYRTIEHTGAQLGFLSMLLLIPETGTGIFISQNNRKETGGFRYDIARAVIDTLLGTKSRIIEAIEPSADFDQMADNYTGTYRQCNYPHNTFEKVSQLFGIFANETKVSYNGDGRLIIFGDPFIMIENNVFQIDRPNSNYKVEFIMGEDGKAERIFAGMYSYEKTSWIERKRPKQLTMISGLVILLIQFLSWPIKWVWRKAKRIKTPGNNSWVSKWKYWTGSSFIFGAIGVLLAFSIYEDQLSDYGVPWLLKLTLLINTIGFISAFVSPWALWKVWTSGRTTFSKVVNSLVIVSIILVAIVLFNTRMVGFQYY